ncbi:MAG TPA: sialidase family protein [Polyangia bacterium]|nr:sialidase family protein [Polyangia bacterium]
MRHHLVRAAALAALVALRADAQTVTPPPAFVTFPLLSDTDAGDQLGFHVADGKLGASAAVTPSAATAIENAIVRAPALPLPQPGLQMGVEHDVSAEADSYEGETAAAATPALLVGGSNHLYPGLCSAAAPTGAVGDCGPLAFASRDGATFTRTPLTRTFNNHTYFLGFDPSVDYDANGVFYFAYGVADVGAKNLGANGVVAVRSTDGVSWTPLTPITNNPKGPTFDDKFYVAVDRSRSAFAGRVYVAWTRDVVINANAFPPVLDQTIVEAYSADGGRSWSAPIPVNDRPHNQRVIGAYPAVDQASGVVYVSWHDFLNPTREGLYVDRSTNGGASWSTDVLAVPTHTGFAMDLGCNGTRGQSPAQVLKVGAGGALYLVYADRVAGRGFDVLFTRSIDGGRTFSPPVRLNDDAGNAHQYHPTLSVAPSPRGDVLTVSFYDRRDDPNNCLSHLYSTWSLDGGASWARNVRQTTQPSNFKGNQNGPGDYSSSAPFAGAAYPFFADHRASNPSTVKGGGFDVYAVNVGGGIASASAH